MELRERIARVIDPEAFSFLDERNIYEMATSPMGPTMAQKTIDAENAAVRLIEAGFIVEP